jgi:Clp amino terminal domain, pathogenicity island component
MPEQPATLDNLISYVRALHPDGDALTRLADAVALASNIEDNADALVGFFVDQARSHGASWSQIGASMGVSKQAAQKRFVSRLEDLVPGGRQKMFTRFTPRARGAVGAAAQAARVAGSAEVEAVHLLVGSLCFPEGLAAKAVRRLEVNHERIVQALGVPVPAAAGDTDPSTLRRLAFSGPAKEALRAALQAALRLGHNYIGTEHLLLGTLAADDETARRLALTGLSRDLVESALAVEIAQAQLEKQQRSAS